MQSTPGLIPGSVPLRPSRSASKPWAQMGVAPRQTKDWIHFKGIFLRAYFLLSWSSLLNRDPFSPVPSGSRRAQQQIKSKATSTLLLLCGPAELIRVCTWKWSQKMCLERCWWLNCLWDVIVITLLNHMAWIKIAPVIVLSPTPLSRSQWYFPPAQSLACSDPCRKQPRGPGTALLGSLCLYPRPASEWRGPLERGSNRRILSNLPSASTFTSSDLLQETHVCLSDPICS